MANAAYGLWPLVVLNTALFVIFAAGFFRPRTRRDWRAMGAYARVRHPQYDALLLIMIGFLLQWPTLPTLVMFPILVLVYVRLARSEERELAARFGDDWAAYAARTPNFFPRRRMPPGADRRIKRAGTRESSRSWR